MGINELSKSQLANYLYVRDIIKSEAGKNNYISVIDMMLKSRGIYGTRAELRT